MCECVSVCGKGCVFGGGSVCVGISLEGPVCVGVCLFVEVVCVWMCVSLWKGSVCGLCMCVGVCLSVEGSGCASVCGCVSLCERGLCVGVCLCVAVCLSL